MNISSLVIGFFIYIRLRDSVLSFLSRISSYSTFCLCVDLL